MKKLPPQLVGLALAALALMPAAGNAADKKLEVFSWWTSGGEAAALDALFKDYKAKNPGVEIVNAAVAGGGGSAARPVLQARLAGGNPPDTWQTHPGFELLDQYVAAGYAEPVTDIYTSEGWNKVIPQGVIDMLSQDGTTYSVLCGVDRGSVLWYAKMLLEMSGVNVGAKMTFDECSPASYRLLP